MRLTRREKMKDREEKSEERKQRKREKIVGKPLFH